MKSDCESGTRLWELTTKKKYCTTARSRRTEDFCHSSPFTQWRCTAGCHRRGKLVSCCSDIQGDKMILQIQLLFNLWLGPLTIPLIQKWQCRICGVNLPKLITIIMHDQEKKFNIFEVHWFYTMPPMSHDTPENRETETNNFSLALCETPAEMLLRRCVAWWQSYLQWKDEKEGMSNTN